ncbi:hypothetical protein MTO96_020659 [Rhipicephalus appendiculatus]
MDSVGSGLAAQQNGSHRKTRNSSTSQDSTERRRQMSNERTTPSDAAGVKASQIASAKAAAPARILNFSSPNTTTEQEANVNTRGRHELIPSKQHGGQEDGRPQAPDQQDRSTGTTQGNTHNPLTRKKDVPHITPKLAKESNNETVTEKIFDVGASADISKATENCRPVKHQQKVNEDHGATGMRSVGDSHASTSPHAERQKPATIGNFTTPAGQVPAVDTTAAVLVPLGQEKTSKVAETASRPAAKLSVAQTTPYSGSSPSPSPNSISRETSDRNATRTTHGYSSPPPTGSATPLRHHNSRPSETVSKGSGTLNDRDVPWRSNPLLALIHRASRSHKPSVSTASCGGGGTESAKLLANATQIRLSTVKGRVREGDVTGARTTLVQGVGKNATDVGHALPRRSVPRRAIVVTPDVAPEKQVPSSELTHRLQRTCSWSLCICITCLAAAVVTGAVLLTYFLNTQHDTRPAKNVEPSRNDFRHICGNEACRSVVDRLLLSMDTRVHPCNNFYRYVCGHWKKSRSDRNLRSSYEKENQINNTLMFHRALYKLTESPALSDYGEHDMALFYRSCHNSFANRSAGKANGSSVEAILTELGIDEASTRVATFQDVFSLALAESMVTGLASLVSAAHGKVGLRINMGATFASILPQGYVEGFLDDTFSEWHSGDERRVVLMGQIDESLEKLRTPCLASESSDMTIRDLKAPFPGGDWLGAFKSSQGENESSAYSPGTIVSVRGETCIVAMLSYMQSISVEEARIYSLAVLYAHMKNYAYMVRHRQHSLAQIARKCLKITAHMFSRTFEAWIKTKILGEDSIQAFATMLDHLKKAAATLPSMPDQLNPEPKPYRTKLEWRVPFRVGQRAVPPPPWRYAGRTTQGGLVGHGSWKEGGAQEKAHPLTTKERP